ncbi:D-alanyl-D-alanine carboxypeptidase [Bifidobacterium xylocopae]|uniref:D-alanyl-D-alanine carboxypeptidase n=1 Tax=Bifidobacterium xylocopae TaxID=2493119 RepID=A0A366KGJ7_9BIFI|nr:D-alanyl-D-alanine carboxypeptidase [Bifidobacterium xylocopae]RBP99811.1 D-alanyl-D-alanine carboxypeptidase [Bifidobacterium xylocopae]
MAAATVIVVFAGYLVADATDVIPGPLTLAGSAVGTGPRYRTEALAPAVVGADLESDTPVDASAAQRVIDGFAASPGVGGDYSVVIANRDGSVAAEHAQGTLRQPASTLKTLTAAAAALSLDMGSTLTTSTYLDRSAGPDPRLVLQGHGDMLLGSGDCDLSHVNGRAGLGTLAKETSQALRAGSIGKVSLAYDPGFFGPERSPQGIDENNPGGVYFTPTSTLAVDEGRMRSDADRSADPDGGGVYLSHDQDPEMRAADTFAQRLAEEGITVVGDPAVGQLPATSKPKSLASVESAPLGQLMAYMLRNSDNSLAELFGRLTAVKLGKENSPRGAVQAVQEALGREGVNLGDGARMADCSGLTPGSLVSVATLAAIQRLACDGRHGRLAPLAEGMAVVGLVGTAAGRGKGSDPNGLVRVKTGSLDQVTAMAGNVSRMGGGLLVFSVIVNNPGDMGGAVQAVNTLMSALPKL